MTVEPGDLVRAVAQISMPDQVDAINVWDFQRYDSQGTNPTDAQVSTALANILVGIYGEIESDLSDLVTVVSSKNYQMGYESGRWVATKLLGEDAVGVQGDATAEMLPHGVAGLINLVTYYSRRYGRKFIPGFTENSMVDGIFSSTPVTNLVAAGLEYLTTHTFETVYQLRAVELGYDGVYHYFSGYGSSGTPAYQRRRKPGVGS